MKYLLTSIGTRGDIEPFIALAVLLKKQGHQVKVACPEQYLYLVDGLGMKSFGLDRRFVELIESEEGKQVMGGKINFFKRVTLLISLYKKSLSINRNLMLQQAQLTKEFNPDQLIFSSKALYGVIHHAKNGGRAIWLTPIPCMIHVNEDFANIGFKVNLGKFLNKMTYALANVAIVKSIKQSSKQNNLLQGLNGINLKRKLKEIPMIYSISPLLYSRKDQWPDHVKVLGYLERDKQLNYQPPIELANFIKKHRRILFLTFGSMENLEPSRITQTFVDLLEELKIPTIINCANGGLKELKTKGKNIHYLHGIPYDWVLPKIYAIIHHGGAGTTHLGLKYACPTMIIPHIADQHHWNSILSQKGLGPKGVAIGKVTKSSRLKEKIADLWSNSIYYENAQKMASKMKEEDVEASFLSFLK